VYMCGGSRWSRLGRTAKVMGPDVDWACHMSLFWVVHVCDIITSDVNDVSYSILFCFKSMWDFFFFHITYYHVYCHRNDFMCLSSG
jgi:hypothetical protein